MHGCSWGASIKLQVQSTLKGRIWNVRIGRIVMGACKAITDKVTELNFCSKSS
jgi:hypothetical protein